MPMSISRFCRNEGSLPIANNFVVQLTPVHRTAGRCGGGWRSRWRPARREYAQMAATFRKGFGETGLLIVVLALVKPLSPPGDLSGQLICGPIEA
jgi:hypothetical protein